MAKKSPKWSKDEIAALRRLYYQVGAERAAELITERFGVHRTTTAVRVKARKVLNSLGIPDGYVALIEVEQSPSDPAVASMSVADAAKKDGVMKTITAYGGRTRVAPIEWAEEYARKRGEMNELVRATRGWLTTKQIAREFGVSPSYINQARYDPDRYPLWRFLREVPMQKVRIRGTWHMMWDPNAALLAGISWRQFRRERYGWGRKAA